MIINYLINVTRSIMQTEELTTKITKDIARPDGSIVRVVAQEFYGAGLKRSVDVYALYKETPDHDWKLCSDRPHPNWKVMARGDYINFGRSELFQKVSHGEILGLIKFLGKPMSLLQRVLIKEDM
jgi:hypothetical protein